MRFIPRYVHGVLDYLSVIGLFALPRMMHWSAATTGLLTLMAGITLIYSLCTRYELGLFRVLSMRGHLILDFLAGLFLCMTPFLYHMPRQATSILVGVGIFEILVSLLSRSESLMVRATPESPDIPATPHPGR